MLFRFCKFKTIFECTDFAISPHPRKTAPHQVFKKFAVCALLLHSKRSEKHHRLVDSRKFTHYR